MIVMLGALAGVLAGLFGIGGGFLLTPMLIFYGIPAPIAVATAANQIIASSFSGFLSHRRNQHVDIALGNFLVIGGFIGAVLGIWLFWTLKQIGQADLLIKILYVFFLLLIAILMLREGFQYRKQRDYVPKMIHLRWLERLPMKRYFEASGVTHSIFAPIIIGAITGLLVALMGVGGGFLLLPALGYLLHIPRQLTVGTTLYHMMATTIVVTMLHAVTTQTVDIMLAALLVVGSSIGSQYGVRLSKKLPHHALRLALGALLLILAIKLGYSLFITPQEIFTLEISR
jgi:uncharacterized membrane protein YfcA